ncbi:hypothetical protein YC2023_022461 [Brassica napus]
MMPPACRCWFKNHVVIMLSSFTQTILSLVILQKYTQEDKISVQCMSLRKNSRQQIRSSSTNHN